MATARKSRSNAIAAMNLGVYNDRPYSLIPDRGLRDALNVRIREGKILRENIGWGSFFDINVENPCVLIDNFVQSDATKILIFASTRDIYEYDEGAEEVLYITPSYITGTADVTNGDATVTGSGTTWTTNVKSGDKIHFGSNAQKSLTATWYTVDSVTSDTELELTAVYAGTTDTGLDYTCRQLFTGNVKDYFVSDTFLRDATSGDDLWIACNGVDYGVSWNGTDDFCTKIFTSEDVVFHSIAVFKNMMVYGNLVVSSSRKGAAIRNSDIGKPLDITNGFASELLVHNGSDWIKRLHSLSDVLVAYSENRITNCQFVDTPVIFVFRDAITNKGLRAGRALVDFGDTHEFVSDDSVYRYDGTSISESGGHVWRKKIKTVSPGRIALLHAHLNQEEGEAVWVVPYTSDSGDVSTGPPEQAIIGHYLESVGDSPRPYTFRELPATATGLFQRGTSVRWSDITDTWAEQSRRWGDSFYQAVFPYKLFGDNNGDIFIIGDLDSKNGSSITSKFRTKRFTLGDGKFKMNISRIYPFTERLPSSGDLTVRVYTANFMDGTATLAKTLTFDMEHLPEEFFVSPRVSARYAEFEFEVAGTGNPFSFAGLDYELTLAGKR